MKSYQAAIDAMTARIENTAKQVTEFPHFADTTTGAWTTSPAGDWTGGFWVGQLWLTHHRTKDSNHWMQALHWARRLQPRARSDTVFRGFLFYYGAAIGAELTRSEAARDIALTGARGLASAYNPVTRAIPLGEEAEEAASVGRSELNIDGVPGTALLAWAAEQTGDTTLRSIGREHAARHIDLCVRRDGSVCQSASVSLKTGEVVRRYTHKGVTDASTWTRAQAWAMVGFALAARWLPDRAELLDTAVRVADWWCDHLPGDGVAYWDFDAPARPDTPRDTSGTAIGAAALLKLAALVPDEARSRRYLAVAEASVRAMLDGYLTPTGGDDARPPGILTDGCYNHRIGLATANELVWGSYYLYEALHVLAGLLEPARI